MRINNVSEETSTQSIVWSFVILLFFVALFYFVIFQNFSPAEFVQAVLNTDDSDARFVFLFIAVTPFILVWSIIYSCIERNKSLKLMRNLGFNLKYADFLYNRIDFCFVDPKYNISCSYEDIEELKMKLHTSLTRTKNGYDYIAVTEIELVFTLLNGKTFSIKNTPFNKLNFIYKIIDYARGINNFSYKFTGYGVSQVVKEKIEDYLKTGCKQILSTKEENNLKFASLLTFGVGAFLFFALSSIITEAIQREDFGIFYAIAPFFLFIVAAIVIDVYLIVDKINDKKFYIRHKSKEFMHKIPCELIIAVEALIIAIMIFTIVKPAIDNNKILNVDNKVNQNLPTENKINQNLNTNDEIVQLKVNLPTELNYKRKDEIYSIRRSYVKNSLFATKNYQPNENVFGAIEDYKPWWGNIRCKQLNHKSDNSENIKGTSQQSIQINNPDALVGLKSIYLMYDRHNNNFCSSDYARFIPQSLKYSQNNNLIIAEYGVSRDFLNTYVQVDGEKRRFPLQLSGLNALDFGYKYVYAFDTKNIEMVNSENITQNVGEFIDFLHTGGSCGYNGGCNNLSPMQNDKMITVEYLPAEINLKLWKNQPVTPYQKADMYYRIKFVAID
jgi:hypothetical protein